MRAGGVTIRNSIVHDVYGDGIVLFQVEDGLIERSAAWRTGLQPRETIGTPNGIWTWRCRRCTVQWAEGFFVDSPGVDGGVYDIDWGNDDNVVQHNFGHDSMGYCASVFAAAGETTSNSTIRHNVCVNNGRSPKLAALQGDLYISTWEGGKLDGVDIHNHTFYWNPRSTLPPCRPGRLRRHARQHVPRQPRALHRAADDPQQRRPSLHGGSSLGGFGSARRPRAHVAGRARTASRLGRGRAAPGRPLTARKAG